mmetsp:Transcript_96519/g.245354  ORF Transcript_96519/g.245354 Transcript_96519/m.245354 type:complete len:227 (-) Transcript_96519:1349-2029(-)
MAEGGCQVVLRRLDVNLCEQQPTLLKVVHELRIVALLRQIRNSLQLVSGLGDLLLDDKALRHRQQCRNVVLLVVVNVHQLVQRPFDIVLLLREHEALTLVDLQARVPGLLLRGAQLFYQVVDLPEMVVRRLDGGLKRLETGRGVGIQVDLDHVSQGLCPVIRVAPGEIELDESILRFVDPPVVGALAEPQARLAVGRAGASLLGGQEVPGRILEPARPPQQEDEPG